MSLIESHEGIGFQGKLECSEKLTIERLDKKEGINIEPRIEHHYTYVLYISFYSHSVLITFMCDGEPKIEKVNKLIKNIMKSIYKFTFIDEQQYEQCQQIIKDSIKYTSFKHSFHAEYAGQRGGKHLIHL